nr:GNAT family N-acetyltransferase [uncultured Caproiciproducens sp.]
MTTKQAIDFLAKDSLIHVDMLESIVRGNSEILQATDQGVLLFDTVCGTYMMSTEDEKTASRMISTVKHADLFVAHQNFYIDAVQNKFMLHDETMCYQAAYFKKEPLPVPNSTAVIRGLDESYLPFVLEHYSHMDDEEYVLDRLKSGAMFGAFVEDRLVGFIGSHAEGSMGMLEVLPEYRRQGFAVALETFLTNHFLAEGYIPYAQIIVDNSASLKLHHKLNFSISNQTICWLT